MPPRRSQRGGAVPANQQPYTPGVIEVVQDLTRIMEHDWLYTIPSEFYELTKKNKLRHIAPIGLNFLPNLHIGGKLYSSQLHEGLIVFRKYQVRDIKKTDENGQHFIHVELFNIQYLLDPNTRSPLEYYLFSNYGKILICNLDTNTNYLYQKIQEQFIPCPEEILYYEVPA